MCAEFMIKENIKALARKLGIIIPDAYLEYPWLERIRPSQKTAVILSIAGHSTIEPMRFSMIPSWSKEPKVKFATHNARLDTITEKATWKRPFLTQRCIIPLTHFLEPIHTGEYDGKVVRFSPKEDETLFAAGIYDRWVNKESGEEIHSFAIITDEPSDFVKNIGHDRQPVFLNQDAIPSWIKEGAVDSKQLISILKECLYKKEFKFEIDRQLKSKRK